MVFEAVVDATTTVESVAAETSPVSEDTGKRLVVSAANAVLTMLVPPSTAPTPKAPFNN